MQIFKSNAQRARLAILFAWIVVATGTISFASSFLQLNLLQSWVDGVPFDETVAAANDLRESTVGLLDTAVNITWMVLFMMWFYRARANLQTRISYPLSYTPGWAVGYFFIPIVCLYRPYQTMKELYSDTRDLFVKDGLTETTALKTGYVGCWWVFWLLSAFVANIVLRTAFRGVETIDDLISQTYAHMVALVLDVLSTLLTIIVIRDYSRVEPMMESLPAATEGAQTTDSTPAE